MNLTCLELWQLRQHSGNAIAFDCVRCSLSANAFVCRIAIAVCAGLCRREVGGRLLFRRWWVSWPVCMDGWLDGPCCSAGRARAAIDSRLRAEQHKPLHDHCFRLSYASGGYIRCRPSCVCVCLLFPEVVVLSCMQHLYFSSHIHSRATSKHYAVARAWSGVAATNMASSSVFLVDANSLSDIEFWRVSVWLCRCWPLICCLSPKTRANTASSCHTGAAHA